MILIADSGSTKTTWMEVETGNKVVTEGLNPHFTTDEQFLAACATVRQHFSIYYLLWCRLWQRYPVQARKDVATKGFRDGKCRS